MRNNYYPPVYRKRHTGVWILLIIVVIIGVIYANSIGLIHFILPNFNITSNNSNASSASTPAQMCTEQINTCLSTIQSKYSSTVSVQKQLQTSVPGDANNFLQTWRGSTQSGDIYAYGVSSFPVTLVATKITIPNLTDTLHVFICDLNGNLLQQSSSGLC